MKYVAAVFVLVVVVVIVACPPRPNVDMAVDTSSDDVKNIIRVKGNDNTVNNYFSVRGDSLSLDSTVVDTIK